MSKTASSSVRVMIVDDSAVVRGLMLQALKEAPGIEVVATAFNGAMAIEQLKYTETDIILLDIEMPVMDGLTALPELLALSPGSRVIMVSMLTLRNAEISLRAFELGASDYLAKPSARADSNETGFFYQELIHKIKALAQHRLTPPASSSATAVTQHLSGSGVVIAARYPQAPVWAVAIGASTGGPQALTALFKGLVGKFPNVPFFITQHMPPSFTTILAQHLGQISGRLCAEGKDGDVVQPGNIYLAPGDYHMVPAKQSGKVIIHTNQDSPVNFCRPAVDPMLQALASIYGTHLLTVILTGMGSDGLNGSRSVAEAGGVVIAQNEQSSVVWGMPRAVAEHKLCSAVLPIEDIAPYIIKATHS